MPQADFQFDDEERKVLEAVRARLGLADCNAAAEWLIKRRLRNASEAITGRGRPLHLAGKHRT